ncbi:hypothetical protein [Arcobacter cloacae]|uniref:Uncharacterized protein n=1 Tax=Arcobacter cloacae TaxID=1054034 RepID=A0A6M8NMR6_9BACT|nr:hypothetical protein [Arcobacter cloacae]QKF89802.1 putative membrane protein [Arcobacter cloacae]RXI37445.1 hypothetical protein CP963_12740 [Arcobacter cloacae]
MENRKTKWLIYTVVIGLLPVIIRALLWLVTEDSSLELLNISDIIIFGLIIHISIINELEHSNEKAEWKTKQNGMSILFITVYSALFALILLSNEVSPMIDKNNITVLVIVMSMVSFFIGYSVHYNNKLQRVVL